jgi:FkbM family methyltransferase
MRYNFIEIGTSDFRTLAQTTGKGISIEPVREYFERLPDRADLIKINAAISDEIGSGVMHYVQSDFVRSQGLHEWLRGCNSLNAPHFHVQEYCKLHGVNYDQLVKCQNITLMRLVDLFAIHDVDEVEFLKIDTEGHDGVIMRSLFDLEIIPTIHKIQFESNSLMEFDEWEQICRMADERGYDHHTEIVRGNEDTILNLR